MFCTKCGKPNDDDATFCEYCGAPISAPVQTDASAAVQPPTYPTPTYQTPPYPPAYAVPAPRKGRKGVVIAIVAVVVLLTVAAGLYFFVLRDKSGGGQISGPPTMTVNGEDIPIVFSGYTKPRYSDDYKTNYKTYTVLFMGKKDSRLFTVEVDLIPEKNTAYAPHGFAPPGTYDSDEIVIEFNYFYFDPSVDAAGKITSNGMSGFHTAEAKTGKYEQNKTLDISVSGKGEYGGQIFEFSASGVIDHYSYDEYYDKRVAIYEEILELS